MFNKKLEKRIVILETGFCGNEDVLQDLIKKFEESHQVCASCGITGHKVDMKEVWDREGRRFYHNGCYAAEFNKHLCPCKCGKWIDNKKKKC